MKKCFVLMLLTLCTFCVFGETGYRGIEWYSNADEIIKKVLISKNRLLSDEENIFIENEFGKLEFVASTPILGRVIQVCYYLGHNGWKYRQTHGNIDDIFIEYGALESVCYIIERERTTELFQKLGKGTRSYPITKTKGDISDLFPKEQELKKLKSFSKDAVDSITRMFFIQFSRAYETDGEEVFSNIDFITRTATPNAPGTLYIYDYNDDTRLYIYDNVITGKAVVVYVPHEQDY